PSSASTTAAERSAQPDRHVDLVALALDEQRDRALGLVDQALQLVHALQRLVVEREDHVARLHARARRRALGLLDQQAAVGLDLVALLFGERTHRDAELARLRLAAAAGVGPRELLGRRLAERGGDLLGLALAPDLELHLRSGTRLADH